MGLLNMILGNASELDPEKLKKEFQDILTEDEVIESAWKVIRDKWVFTNKRLIMVDVQGVTGLKKEYHSIPYASITQFSIETPGTIDEDCEMKIWLKGQTAPFVKEFKRHANLKEIQKALAAHVMQ